MNHTDALTRLAACRANQPDAMQVVVASEIVDAWEARTASVLDDAAAVGPPDHFSDYAADAWKAGRDAAIEEARFALGIAAAVVREGDR